MKKIFLFMTLICFFSVAGAMQEEPYTKEDFRQRMDNAISHNKQQLSILISYEMSEEELFEEEVEELTEEEKQKVLDDRKKLDELKESAIRLDELKEDAIKEYNVFFDAYYSVDTVKVKEQTEKLKVIFDEMNPLMVTVIKFNGIYDNILYWSIKLDYLIEKGLIDSDPKVIDNSKPIKAVQEKTGTENQIDDCCVIDSSSECCKEKIDDCCITDPNSDCCKEKPSQDNLFIPIAAALIIIVIVLLYVAFARKR